MKKYSPELLKKEEIVVFNKTDLIDKDEISEKMRSFKKSIKKSVLTTSTLDKISISDIKSKLLNYVP